MNEGHDRTVIVGLFWDHAAAQRCYEALRSRGHDDDDMNLMMSERTRQLHWSPKTKPGDKRTRETGSDSMGLEGMGVGGAVGTAIGGSIAAIAAIGTSLVIPGLNLVVAGPLIAALAGGGAGALTGGLVGGLIGLGMTEENAEVYSRALREGGTVLGVSVREGDDLDDVKRIFRACSATQIQTF